MVAPKKRERYQDYVIKDGRLVGEFELLYRNVEDPWHQLQDERNPLDKTIGITLLTQHGHHRPLEYGCGLGHFTLQLLRACGAAAGIDISPTAIEKARRLHPGPEYFAGDIVAEEPLDRFQPDALVFSQVTWYVLDKLGAFKALLGRRPNLGFVHLLQVYAPGTQQYGREYFVDLESIRQYWSDVIDIRQWGEVRRPEDEGGGRTFLYGVVR